VDAANAEAPGLQSAYEVVKRVLELCEKEQALVRMIKKSFPLKQVLEFRELRLIPTPALVESKLAVGSRCPCGRLGTGVWM
jgi:hypothetical protein